MVVVWQSFIIHYVELFAKFQSNNLDDKNAKNTYFLRLFSIQLSNNTNFIVEILLKYLLLVVQNWVKLILEVTILL